MADSTSEKLPGLVESAELESIELVHVTMDAPTSAKRANGSLEIKLQVSGEIETDDSEAGPAGWYRTRIGVSIAGTPSGEHEGEDVSPPEFSLRYQTTYKLRTVQDWPKEEREHFELHCACYHTWPYIRELTQNLTARSPISPITLPMLPRTPSRDAGADTDPAAAPADK